MRQKAAAKVLCIKCKVFTLLLANNQFSIEYKR